MAIKKKSKMGSMLGVKPIEVAMPTNHLTHESEAAQGSNKALSQVVPSTGNKPRFELIQGEEEKKVNIFLPSALYKQMSIQAKIEDKTMKQFVGEIILQAMMERYGYQP